MAWRNSASLTLAAISGTVMSDLPVIRRGGGGGEVVEEVVADVVVLPVDRVVARVRAGVAPMPAQVVTLVGGARAAEGEQVAGDLDGHLAGECLGLGDGH